MELGSRNVHRAGRGDEGRYRDKDSTAGDKRADRARPSHRRSGPHVTDSDRPRTASEGSQESVRLTAKLDPLSPNHSTAHVMTGVSEGEMDALLAAIGAPAKSLNAKEHQLRAVRQLAPRLSPSQRQRVLEYATRDDITFPIETTMHTVGPLLGAMSDEEMEALHTKIFAPRVVDPASAKHGHIDTRLPSDAKVGTAIGVLLSSVDISAPPDDQIGLLARWACEDGCDALRTIVVTEPANNLFDEVYRPRIDPFASLLRRNEQEQIFTRALSSLPQKPDAAGRMTKVAAELSTSARKALMAQLDAIRRQPGSANPRWPGR